MATWALGDIQGCYECLQRLLDKLCFDPTADRLWFAGDLVNRGPDSLATLRFVKSLGDTAVTVLGNHDIHLLAVYYGLRPPDKDPTLLQVLEAPDVDELINWLTKQPLLHVEHSNTLVHAGIHPHWSLDTAISLARDIESALREEHVANAMATIYGPASDSWEEVKDTRERLRYALNVFTRMRFCTQSGSPDYTQSCTPGEQPDHLVPWFDVSNRKLQDTTIIFGHWAALGVKIQPGICALDSGCVWGNQLTAYNLQDHSIQQVSCE